MKKTTLAVFIFCLSTIRAAGADNTLPFPLPPPLNKISYQLTVEKWAATRTAKVTINMDAALDKVGLSNINQHVLDTLRKMAPDANWHVTQFNRTQDKSGLEMLHVEAEARLAQDILASLRDKAKQITQPGETYTVGDIDFAPALTEMQKTEAEARADIYAQVKGEIDALNKVYPDQHYFLNQIDFNTGGVVPITFKAPRNAMAAEVSMVTAAPMPADIPINAKVTEVAQVVIAASVAKLP